VEHRRLEIAYVMRVPSYPITTRMYGPSKSPALSNPTAVATRIDQLPKT
jgi:hypothetical protein